MKIKEISLILFVMLFLIGCGEYKLDKEYYRVAGNYYEDKNDIFQKIYSTDLINDSDYRCDLSANETCDQDEYIKLLQLVYHSVGESNKFSVDINISKFEDQMNYLRELNYSTVTFQQYYEWKKFNNFSMPKKSVILAFDDGLKNTYTNASKIMDKYGFFGVVSIIGKDIGLSSRLNDSEIQILQKHGWEIASHSVSHISFLELNEGDQISELKQSRNKIESKYNVLVKTFVFPYDQLNLSILNTCLRYYNICTLYSVKVYYSNFSRLINYTYAPLARINIKNSLTMDEFKLIV